MARTTVGQLVAELVLDAAKFGAGLQQAAGMAQQFANQFTKKFVSSMNEAYQASAQLTALLGFGAGGLGAAITALGASSIQLASEFETAEAAFTSFLGSAEKARSFMDDLAKFASKTPFELRGLREAAQRLMQTKMAAQDVLPTLESLGNLMAASGNISRASLDRVYFALGQIAQAGRLMGQDAMQLTQAMIPVWDALAVKLGKTTSEVRKLQEEGKISAQLVFEALREYGKLPQYAGLSEKIMGTITGKLSNLQDAIDNFKTEFGKRIAEAFDIKGIIQGFINLIDQAREALSSGKFYEWFKRIQPELEKTAAIIAGMLTPAVVGFTAATLVSLSKLAPWGLAGLAVYQVLKTMGIGFQDVTYAIGRVVTAFEGLQKIVSGVLKAGQATVVNFVAASQYYFGALAKLLRGVKMMWDGAIAVPMRENALAFQENLNNIGRSLARFARQAAAFLQPIVDSAKAILGPIGNAIGQVVTNLFSSLWTEIRTEAASTIKNALEENAILAEGVRLVQEAKAELTSGKKFDLMPELYQEGLRDLEAGLDLMTQRVLNKQGLAVKNTIESLVSKLETAFSKVDVLKKVDYSQEIKKVNQALEGEDDGKKSKKDDPVLKRVNALAEQVQLLKEKWDAGYISQQDYLNGLKKLLPELDALYRKYGDNIERGVAILRLANAIRQEVGKDWEGESLKNTLEGIQKRAVELTSKLQDGTLTIDSYEQKMKDLVVAVEALRESYATTPQRAIDLNNALFDLTGQIDKQKKAAQELADAMRLQVAEAYRIAADKATAWANAAGFNEQIKEVQPDLDTLEAGLLLPLEQYEGAEWWQAFERLKALMENPRTNPLIKNVIEPIYKVALQRIESLGQQIGRALEAEGDEILQRGRNLTAADQMVLEEAQKTQQKINELADEAWKLLDSPTEMFTRESIEAMRKLILALLPFESTSEKAALAIARLEERILATADVAQGLEDASQQAARGITSFTNATGLSADQLALLNDELIQLVDNEQDWAKVVGDEAVLGQLRTRIDALERLRSQMIEAGRAPAEVEQVEAVLNRTKRAFESLTKMGLDLKRVMAEDADAANLLARAQATLARMMGTELDEVEQLINTLRVKAVLDEKNAALYRMLADTLEDVWIEQKLKNQQDEEAILIQKQLDEALRNTYQALDGFAAAMAALDSAPVFAALNKLVDVAKVVSSMMQDSQRQVSHAEAVARGFERAYVMVNALAGAVSALSPELGKMVASMGNLAVAGFQMGGPVGGVLGGLAGLIAAVVDIVDGGRRRIEQTIAGLSSGLRLMSRNLYEVAYREEKRYVGRIDRPIRVRVFDEQMAQRLKEIAEPLEQGFASAFASALRAVAQGEKDWQMAFRNAIRLALLDAFITAFLQSQVFAKLLREPLEKYVQALEQGNTEAAKQWLGVILKGIPQIMEILEKAGVDLGKVLGFEKIAEESRKTYAQLANQFSEAWARANINMADYKKAAEEFAEYLGVGLEGLQEQVRSAFSANTYEEFVTNLEQAVHGAVRNAIVQAFLEEPALKVALQGLRDLILQGLVTGGQFDMGAINQYVEEIKQKSRQVYELLDRLGLLPKALADGGRDAAQQLSQSIKSAFQAASLEDFAHNLNVLVGRAVTDALIESFMAAAPVQAAIKAMSDFIAEAIKDGMTGDEVMGLQERIAGLRDLLGPMFEQVLHLMKSLGLIAEQVDAATRAAQERVDSIQSGLENAIASAFNAQNLEDFLTYLGEATNAVLRDAVIKAFMETAAVQSIVKTVSMVISEAVIDGVLTATEMQLIQGNLNLLRQQLIPMFDMLSSLGILNGSFERLNKTVEETKNKIEEVGESLTNVPAWFKVGEARYFAASPMIPAFGDGGIVTRPTLALIGERGPEAVVPLGQVGGIHIHGDVYGFDDFQQKVFMAYERARADRNLARTGSRLRS